ncbi:hypothetical protein UM93_07500 [Psychromicrobium lacuslunae]|uniref:Uncharacterized protein n=1 Tax=Psychromicrobium lacuslunae TaxID=1618207 RepID=A0A0D4C3K8_9MICC|nr:hypothetical protein UM93_07500 [Psychromicrobium lacuslunae]
MAVLAIGYMLLSLMIVATVTAASALYIESKKLLSVADGAAAAAADQISLNNSQSHPGLHLDSNVVISAAQQYLKDYVASGEFDQLSISAGTGSPDGQSARVVLTAVAHPPILSLLIPDGIPISAESTSRPQLHR